MQKYTKQQEFSYQISRLRAKLQNEPEVKKLSQAQEVLAHVKGFKNWHDFQSIQKYHHEYTQSNKGFKLHNTELYHKWHTMLDNEEIITIDTINLNKKTRTLFSIEEIQTTQYNIFNKKTKRFLGIKEEQISLNETNFPLLVLGSSGSGKVELLNRICKTVIDNGKGLITLDGIGYTRQVTTNLYYAKAANREEDVFILNLHKHDIDYITNKDFRRKTNTINPLDSLLLSFKSFSNVFGQEVSKWLYPAIKSYENKAKKPSLKSLGAFLKLPQLFLMANSNEWNNQEEVIDYLKSINLTINDSTEEQIKEAVIKHTVKSLKALEIISIIEEYIEDGVFTDTPEISLINIFNNNKILSIVFPTLERSPPRYIFLKNLIQEMLIIIDGICGSKNNFIAFFENSNPHKFTSNKINISWDFYGLAYEIYSYMQFTDEHNEYEWKNWEINEKNFNEYNSFFLMRVEDPEGLHLFKNLMIERFWGYQNLEAIKNISNQSFLKYLREGQGYLLTSNNRKLFCEDLFVIYEDLSKKELFIKVDILPDGEPL